MQKQNPQLPPSCLEEVDQLVSLPRYITLPGGTTLTNCREFKTLEIGTEELDAVVSAYLKNGWSLHGSPFEANGDSYQVIVLFGCESEGE